MPQNSFSNYNSGGYRYTSGPQKNLNKLLTVYANYNKTFDAINSSVDATIGYDYQHWRDHGPAYDTYNEAGDIPQIQAQPGTTATHSCRTMAV